MEVSGQVNIMDAGCLCVGRQYLENHDIILCGRCSTWSTSREVRGNLVTNKYYGPRMPLRGRGNIWNISISFCIIGAAFTVPPERSAAAFACSSSFFVASAALAAPQSLFAWQV